MIGGRRGIYVSVFALGALHACSDARSIGFSRARSQRHEGDGRLDVLWRTAGALADVNRPSPLRAVPSHGRVFVVDANNARLYALRLADGGLLWDSRTTAPSAALDVPHDVAVTADQTIVVADIGRKGLVLFDTTGKLLRFIPIRPTVYSLCGLRNRVLMYTFSLNQPVWALDLGTGDVRKADLPWADLHGALPDETSGTLQSDAAHGACVFALETGDGFAVWRNGRFGQPHAFVEHVVPEFGKQVRSAMSASLVGDDVYVAFSGRSKQRRRLIDVYSATSGAYKVTLAASDQLYWLAPAGEAFVGISPTSQGRDILRLTMRKVK
jgi:PQQ-like domain